MAAPFVNWARNVRSQPSAWVAPASEGEVIEAVRGVASRGGRLRVVGARHSWSPLAAPDDVAMDLGAMDRVLAVAGDRVTVEGGCRLRDLIDVLARNGRALPICGSVDAQTVAGLTATGTHGSSLVHGNLSSLVRRLRLVGGDGTVHELDGDALVGGRVHLGALGVVTEVDLETVPLFGLEETCEVLPFDEAIHEISDVARAEEYVKWWWIPHTDAVLRFVARRTERPWTLSDGQWRREKVLAESVFPAILAVGGALPGLVPLIHRLFLAVHFRPYRETGRWDRMLMVPGAPVHRETELALPVERAGDALGWLRAHVRHTGARADFIQELRLVPADPAWMSPAHGRDTCQLGVYAARSPERAALFDAFRAQAAAWDARPHWGKELGEDPSVWRRAFPELDRFRALAGRLDPRGTLRNPTLDAVLGRAA